MRLWLSARRIVDCGRHSGRTHGSGHGGLCLRTAAWLPAAGVLVFMALGCASQPAPVGSIQGNDVWKPGNLEPFPDLTVKFTFTQEFLPSDSEMIKEKVLQELTRRGFKITQGAPHELGLEFFGPVVGTRGFLYGITSSYAKVSLKVNLRSVKENCILGTGQVDGLVDEGQTSPWTNNKKNQLLKAQDDAILKVTRKMQEWHEEGCRLAGIIITPPPSPRPPPPSESFKPQQQWAVVIGVDSYRDNRIPALACAEKDAREIANVFHRKMGFKEDHIKVILGKEGTQQNIRSALGTWLARNTGKEDLVLIFYAGHGAPEIDPTKNSTKKSQDGWAKYLVPHDAKADDLYATGIPMAEIATIFDRIEAERVIFISDACYSGAAGGRSSFALGGTRGVNVGDLPSELTKGKGRVILTAGGIGEPVFEDKASGHGLFTQYLLEGLSGKAANTQGDVTLAGLYNYVSGQVTGKSRLLGGAQHPVMKGEMQGDIILVPSDKKAVLSPAK